MPFGRPRPTDHNLDHEFEIIKPLVVNEGNFNAGIYKVRCIHNGQICVEKRFKERDIRDDRALNEVRLVRACQHRNINEYVHAFCEESRHGICASIYMDFCDLGSLNDTLEKHHKEHRGIGEAFVWSAFKDLANAIGYMQFGIHDTVHGGHRDPHWHPIIHRDIAPRNVFLKSSSEQRYPRVILGDFGCGDFVELIKPERPRFDPYWAPPEAPHFGATSDVWSMGAVIQAMVRLDGPAERYGTLANGRHHRGAGNGYSAQLNKALAYAMAEDPRGRLGIRELAPRLRAWEKEAEAVDYEMEEWEFERR
ncbi:hypothetical protein MMC30_002456 [Trapelia coarctata]|nr:hypothetical protein [Trapelia coarctata]